MTKIAVKNIPSNETLAVKEALKSCFLIKSLCELVNQKMYHDLFLIDC